ncbi:2-phospho-L-lactate transferase [Candidatus Bathyarchaeota archaeon]|nr:2-phospho-L-lactate transferase [Candidatus Bathyarchaeota archaeon]
MTCLAGGVGAARFLQGVTKVIPPEDLTVIVNTGDDMNLYGLHISPDIDIITYTLAGIVDEEKGWGIRNDSFNFLEQLRRYGHNTWFNLGDHDLATHINRTILLNSGHSLSEVTDIQRRVLGVKTEILPMSDDRFETHIRTEKGLIHFEEYLVKYGASKPVLGVEFIGGETAKPLKSVIDSITESELVLVAPSNPIVSIGTILSLEGVKEALATTDARIGGVSPIIGGIPVKGPADKLMEGLGYEVRASSVALIYKEFLDHFVIDEEDEEEAEVIKDLGIDVSITNTIMKTIEDKVSLAEKTLEALAR